MPPLSQFYYEYIGLDAHGYLKLRDSFLRDYKRFWGGDAQRVLKVSASNTVTGMTIVFHSHDDVQ